MNKRIVPIDAAKGVALLAVIIGHTEFAGVPQSLVRLCYTFSMPLFFIVSGYFFKQNGINKSFIIKNIKSLIIPYIVTGIIQVILIGLQAIICNDDIINAIIPWVVAVAYGSGGTFEGMPESVIGIGAIWFLLALFWARLLLAVASETKHPALCSIVFFIIGVSTARNIWIPLSIQPGLCAVGFLYIGQQLKREKIFENGEGLHPVIWILSLAVWAYCVKYCGQLYMSSNYYGNGVIDVIGGIAGSVCIVKGIYIIYNKYSLIPNFLAYIGRNSLPLLCAHLLELNTVRWSNVITFFENCAMPTWLIIVLLQIVLTIVLYYLIYFSPKRISGIFFSR